MSKRSKRIAAKIVSIVTLVPVVAAATTTWIYAEYSELFVNKWWYIYSLLFLVFIPISAYPLKYLFPSIMEQGRKGERKLAFITSIIGYVLGTILCFILRGPDIVIEIFLAYLFSGIVLSFINKVIKFKASGHACGISGPLTLLIYFIGRRAIWTAVLLPLVYWSREQLGRHTNKELIAGTLVGVFSSLFALVII